MMAHKILKIIYQPYKWFIYFPILVIDTLAFGVFALLGSILVNQRFGSYLGGVVWSRFNASIVPMLVTVEGKEKVNKKQSYVVIPNHQSYYDIFLIYGWLGIDIKFVMKKELRKIPGLGFGSAKVGHIFLDRSNARAALESLSEAKRKLVNGTSVVIFPEGTRSKSGKLGTFKRGAFKLALDLELPILPVTVINTKNILPSDTVDLMPGKVKLIIHDPIDISSYSENNMSELITKVRETIEDPLFKSI